MTWSITLKKEKAKQRHMDRCWNYMMAFDTVNHEHASIEESFTSLKNLKNPRTVQKAD